MVDWLDGDEFGVKDIDTQSLRENLIEKFKKCRDDQVRNLGIRLEEAFIVGSVARGDASKGMSDIDIIIVLTSDEVGNMNPKFDVATANIAKCLEDEWQLFATQNMLNWITGADIMNFRDDEVDEIAFMFGRDTRTNENFESEYIYDILGDEFHR